MPPKVTISSSAAGGASGTGLRSGAGATRRTGIADPTIHGNVENPDANPSQQDDDLESESEHGEERSPTLDAGGNARVRAGSRIPVPVGSQSPRAENQGNAQNPNQAIMAMLTRMEQQMTTQTVSLGTQADTLTNLIARIGELERQRDAPSARAGTVERGLGQQILEDDEPRRRHESVRPSHSPVAADAFERPYTAAPEPKLNPNLMFEGNDDEVEGFLLRLENLFLMQPRTFYNDIIKVRYAVTSMKGTALEWIKSVYSLDEDERPAYLSNYALFAQELRDTFGEEDQQTRLADKLDELVQKGSVKDYWREFNALHVILHYDDKAAMRMFRRGLKREIKDLLITFPTAHTLVQLKNNAIEADNRVYARSRDHDRVQQDAKESKAARETAEAARLVRREIQYVRDRNTGPVAPAQRFNNQSYDRNQSNVRVPPAPTAPSAPLPGPRPGQTPQEAELRRKRYEAGLCVRCGKPGHYARDCPTRPEAGKETTGDVRVRASAVEEDDILLEDEEPSEEDSKNY